jgi:hypothetical protein
MTTYLPNRRRQWRLCLFTLGIGTSALIMALASQPRHASTGVDYRWLSPGLIVIAILFLPVGLVVLQALVRGVPRLTLDEDKLTFRSVYRTSSVRWEDLGIFVPNFRHGPPYYRPISATARILRPAAGGWRVRKSVEVSNAFLTPLEVILEDIAARNPPQRQSIR